VSSDLRWICTHGGEIFVGNPALELSPGKATNRLEMGLAIEELAGSPLVQRDDRRDHDDAGRGERTQYPGRADEGLPEWPPEDERKPVSEHRVDDRGHQENHPPGQRERSPRRMVKTPSHVAPFVLSLGEATRRPTEISTLWRNAGPG
jgi:hypothetical protein